MHLLGLCKLPIAIDFILFRKIDDLRGGFEKKDELMNAPKDRAGGHGADGLGRKDDTFGVNKPNTQFIVDDLVRAYNDGKIVYCRFGKQYIVNLERQMNSQIGNNG